MRALAVADRCVQVVNLPDPSPGPGEVLVAPHACGICGSDVHGVEIGRCRPGQVLGHEFAGVVVAAGRDAGAWHEGDAVAVNPLGSCGACPECDRGLSFRCKALPNIGISAPGGFAEYVVVPAGQLVRLPEGVDAGTGAHVEPLAVALHAAHAAGAAPGTRALVYGIGAIGLSMIMALRALGAEEIVAIGRSPGRRRAAGKVGTDDVFDGRASHLDAYFAERAGQFDAVFECSGAPEAITRTLPVLRSNGTLVEVALGGRAVLVDLFELVARNARLAGSCAFGPAEFAEAIGLIASGAADPAPLVSRRVGLADAPQAFLDLRHPQDLVGVQVEPWR